MSMILLANLSEIARYSRNSSTGGMVLVILSFLLILMAIGLIVTLVERMQKEGSKPGKKRKESLEDTLARELGLNAAEMNFIKRLAQDQQLPAFELLFVDPSLWGHCTNSAPRQIDFAKGIMAKLFGPELAHKHLGGESEVKEMETAAN